MKEEGGLRLRLVHKKGKICHSFVSFSVRVGLNASPLILAIVFSELDALRHLLSLSGGCGIVMLFLLPLVELGRNE